MYRRRMCTHFHKGVRLLSVLSASFPWPRSASSLILSLPALSCLCVLLPSLPANQDKKKNPNPPACCLQMVHSLLRASECSTSGSRDLSPAVSTDHTLPPCPALPQANRNSLSQKVPVIQPPPGTCLRNFKVIRALTHRSSLPQEAPASRQARTVNSSCAKCGVCTWAEGQ